MTPVYSLNNETNGRLGYFKIFSYFSHFSIWKRPRSNIQNLLFCKLVKSIFFTPDRSTALSISIFNIIGISTNPQMIRINTISYIARMANAHAVRNFSFKKLVANSVSKFGFAIIYKAISVALLVKPLIPQPTCIGFCNFFQKSLLGSLHRNCVTKGPLNV